MRSRRPKKRKRKSEGTPLHLVLGGAAKQMPRGNREGRWDSRAWKVDGGKRAGEKKLADGEKHLFGCLGRPPSPFNLCPPVPDPACLQNLTLMMSQ